MGNAVCVKLLSTFSQKRNQESDMDFLRSLTVADEVAKAAALAYLSSCGRPANQRYPFGNPVSVENTHLPLLQACPYYVADKSDGVRGCVVMCRVGHLFSAVLLDRTGKAYGLPMQADAVFFEGTVIDAELVATTTSGGDSGGEPKYRILAFDACAIAGNREVEYMALSTRLALMTSCLSHVQCTVAPLVVKRMFRLGDDSAHLAAYVAALDYGTDGYILTPEGEPVCQPGTAAQIFKIKECHTMDFMWSGNMLWYGDQKDLFPVSSLQLQFKPEQLKHVSNGTIVEMSPQQAKDKSVVMLHFSQERADKDTPNTYMTVTRTLQSILDALTLDNIVASLAAAALRS